MLTEPAAGATPVTTQPVARSVLYSVLVTRYSVLILGGTLLLGLALRLVGLDFGLPLQLHPDEHTQVDAALRILGGDLNPHFFRYPGFFIYQLVPLDLLARLAAGLAGTPLTQASYFLVA